MGGVSYELWELETGNLVGGYDTEAAALAVVRRSIQRWGRESVATLALAREARCRTTALAEGEALAGRALAAAPEAPARSASSSSMMCSAFLPNPADPADATSWPPRRR